MASTRFARLPGFRDFPPAEMALRNHIVEAWRRVSRRYGFTEYEGPPLEPLELYLEKSGEEIADQLYAFTDKGGREITLRPEMTPSLARILGERSRAMSKPIRWFSVPQLFRYERQQRGRLREHLQWNVDIVGEEGVAADAEILAVALEAMRELGLGAADVRARVSDRRLLASVFAAHGVDPDRFPNAFAAVDKLEREGADTTRAKLSAGAGVDLDAAAHIVELLQAGDLEAVATALADSDEVAAEIERLRAYVDTLDALGFADFVEVDLSIVRGLAYYTGIVFELFDREGQLRSICGGGRYDRLLELVGGEPLPAVGFGMGDVVLCELLTERDLVPPYEPRVDYFVVTVSAELRPAALGLAQKLREGGHSVAYALRDQGVGKQLKTASREGAVRAVIVAPEEWARGSIVVRDMADGEEREVLVDELG